jgi:hypothetical protein
MDTWTVSESAHPSSSSANTALLLEWGVGGVGGYLPSNRESDPRYDHRFEFKYDGKKRLTEKTDFLSNGDLSRRYVYKYEGNQKEESVYLADSSLSWRSLYVFDDKGNVIEVTDLRRTVRSPQRGLTPMSLTQTAIGPSEQSPGT